MRCTVAAPTGKFPGGHDMVAHCITVWCAGREQFGLCTAVWVLQVANDQDNDVKRFETALQWKAL